MWFGFWGCGIMHYLNAKTISNRLNSFKYSSRLHGKLQLPELYISGLKNRECQSQRKTGKKLFGKNMGRMALLIKEIFPVWKPVS